jgi:hypothetical protein
MPANGFTNARTATSLSSRFRVTVACSARMAQTLVHQFRKVASKAGAAVSPAIAAFGAGLPWLLVTTRFETGQSTPWSPLLRQVSRGSLTASRTALDSHICAFLDRR